jgi:predicted kinase
MVRSDGMTAQTPPGPRPPRSGSLHQQVARSIRNQIQAGRLKHGQVLASTRELAAEWNVSVFTINEAMRVLAEEGLIVSQSRSKRTVNYPGGTLSVTWRPEIPHVLLVGGYPGSGKSELSRILARQSGWPMIDKDTITRPVVETALEILGHSPHDRESPEYLESIRPSEYAALAATTLENVECGNSAIVTAPFLREFKDKAWIDRTTASLASHKAVTTLVWIYCDADTMHRYMRQRGAARDAAKLADWPGYLSGIDLDLRPPVPHEVIDNSASSAPLQNQAKALIDKVLQVPS